jgi:hypothetical protein
MRSCRSNQFRLAKDAARLSRPVRLAAAVRRHAEEHLDHVERLFPGSGRPTPTEQLVGRCQAVGDASGGADKSRNEASTAPAPATSECQATSGKPRSGVRDSDVEVGRGDDADGSPSGTPTTPTEMGSANFQYDARTSDSFVIARPAWSFRSITAEDTGSRCWTTMTRRYRHRPEDATIPPRSLPMP